MNIAESEWATEGLRELVTALDACRQDPDHSSRWRHRRHRAEKRTLAAKDALQAAEMALRGRFVDALVAEAVLRVSAQPLERDWYRPGAEDVLADIKARTGARLVLSSDHVARSIYRGATLTVCREDLRLVREHKARLLLGRDSQSVLTAYSVVPRPHASSARVRSEVVAELARLLDSDAVRLPRPVTVWRGEYGYGDGEFNTSARDAKLGDVLVRGESALSASMDPGIAAGYEFCHMHGFAVERPGSGWVLRITTRQALYVADQAQGLASEEEILVHAPRLVVTDVFEGLAETDRGLTRVPVIACEPLQS